MVQDRLGSETLVLQRPYMVDGDFRGIIDLVENEVGDLVRR